MNSESNRCSPRTADIKNELLILFLFQLCDVSAEGMFLLTNVLRPAHVHIRQLQTKWLEQGVIVEKTSANMRELTINTLTPR
jgi:hypothetical protein